MLKKNLKPSLYVRKKIYHQKLGKKKTNSYPNQITHRTHTLKSQIVGHLGIDKEPLKKLKGSFWRMNSYSHMKHSFNRDQRVVSYLNPSTVDHPLRLVKNFAFFPFSNRTRIPARQRHKERLNMLLLVLSMIARSWVMKWPQCVPSCQFIASSREISQSSVS